MVEYMTMHEAGTNPSRLIRKAAAGDPVIITRFGKPMVRGRACASQSAPRKFGFLKGKTQVPNDFDTMGREEIRQMFEGSL